MCFCTIPFLQGVVEQIELGTCRRLLWLIAICNHMGGQGRPRDGTSCQAQASLLCDQNSRGGRTLVNVFRRGREV